MKLSALRRVKRVRNPQLDGDVAWLRSNFINGIKSMPIRFDVVDAA